MKKTKPTPKMLGTGAAAKAAKKKVNRKARLQEALSTARGARTGRK